MKNFSKDAFEFRQSRIIFCNKGAGVVFFGGLGGPNSMKMEGARNLFGYEG